MPEEHALVLLSGADRQDLIAAINSCLERLKQNPHDMLEAVGKSSYPERLAIVAPQEKLTERLIAARQRIPDLRRNRLTIRSQGIYLTSSVSPGRIAFLFPGQGSQSPGMLRDARSKFPQVARWFDRLDEVHRRHRHNAPSALLDVNGGEESRRALFDIGHGAQLGTAANLGLFELITSLGIEPHAVVGHSNGEHAAVIAACLHQNRLDAACDWLFRASLSGSRLPQPDPAQSMLAVSSLAPEKLAAICARQNHVFVAMENCPNQQVIAGHALRVAAAETEIIAAGGICGKLPFTRAYHTPLFLDWSRLLERSYDGLPLDQPICPIFTCATASAMPSDASGIRRAMASQWLKPVRFRAAIEALFERGFRTFLEVGPDSKLSSFVDDTLRGREFMSTSTCSAFRDDTLQLQHALAALHVQGFALRAPSLSPRPAKVHTAALAAVVAGQQQLIDDTRLSLTRMDAFMRSFTPAARSTQHETRTRLSLTSDPWLADHSLGRQRVSRFPLPVLSFTTSMAFAAQAAKEIGVLPAQIARVRAHRWLALDGGELTLHSTASRSGSSADVVIAEAASQPPAFEAAVSSRHAELPPLRFEPGRAPEAWNVKRFYSQYAFHGSTFQGLSRVRNLSTRNIEADLIVTRLPSTLAFDPALLDSAGQLVAFWLLEWQRREPTFGIFPYALARINLYRAWLPPGTQVQCRGEIELREGGTTSARFEFHSGGSLVASMEGFEQRLIQLPTALAGWILHGEASRFSEPFGSARRIVPSQWNILSESGEIWMRTLAHLLLSEAEFDHWLRINTRDTRFTWLLERILVKEAILEWLPNKAHLHQITLDATAAAIVAASFIERPSRIIVGRETDCLTVEVVQ